MFVENSKKTTIAVDDDFQLFEPRKHPFTLMNVTHKK